VPWTQPKLMGYPNLLNWQGLPHPVHSITDVEDVHGQWHKIVPLCTLHKEKVLLKQALLRQAALTGFHP